MGCGSSIEVHRKSTLPTPRDTGSAEPRTADRTPADGVDTDAHDPGKMLSRRTNLSQGGSEDHKNKSPDIQQSGSTALEKCIHSLVDVSTEDVRECMALASQHPDLSEEFALLIGYMGLFYQNKHRQFVKEIFEILLTHETGTKKFSHMIDFFAYIGGARATVQVYKNTLKECGWTHITEEILNERSLEGPAERLMVNELRMFWVDSTDASLEFSARLAETGLFTYLVKDVENLPDSGFKNGAQVFDTSVTILYNIARNPKLRQFYRDISAVVLLTPMLARKETDVKLLTLLTLSYIIDEEDNHLLLADDSDFDFLLEMVGMAWETNDHRDQNGYSLGELLQGLSNLAQNDANKKLLMKKGVVDCLKPILQDGIKEEKQEAVKVMWELAFDKDNQAIIQDDSSLMDILHALKTHNNRNIARNANGALWVMNMGQKVKEAPEGRLPPPPPPPPPAGSASSFGMAQPSAPSTPLAPLAPAAPMPRASSAGKGHIMISYQWDNQKTLLQIRNSLCEKSFRVWMDIDNISGSTLQAMAEAVEGASVVLMCMSQRYKDSPNCRTEAEYAFALHKPIIPLLMERNYHPNGWLGILLGANLFFDFSGKYSYEQKVNALIRELQQRGCALMSEVDGAGIAVVKQAPLMATRPLDRKAISWSQEEVAKWLFNNELDGHKSLQNLSGENIKFLQKLSHRAPEFYFTYLKQDLGLKGLNDLMHFSNAIDKLT